MGKRVNKTTRFVVDVSKVLREQGLPEGLALELALSIKHPKDTAKLTGQFRKKVSIDFTKVIEDEAVSS